MASTATQTMDKRWYIVHAYSNFEKKVAESIREQAKQRGLEELFEQVLNHPVPSHCIWPAFDRLTGQGGSGTRRLLP